MPLGLIAVVMVFAGCGHSDTQTSIPIPIKPAQNAYFKTQFQDESQFIVETIATDLDEQIFYAKNHRLPDSSGFSVRATETPGSSFEQPTYDLQVTFGPDHPPVETELKITGPIWSPEPYSGLVSALAREAGLNAPAPARQSGDTDLLQSLTDSSAITIETENKKLSKALEADFSNPLLHEQAALLLGAFTLRDHSGSFYDIRTPLCRITAHLCMARYLAGGTPPGINGQFAGAILLTLMNDQVPALDALSSLPNTDAAAAAWTKTLQTYNTTDYRITADQEGATPIERVAWFRAYGISADVDTAWRELNETEKRTPDFVRVAHNDDCSVDTGHELLDLSVPLELNEIGAVYKLSHGENLQKDNLVRELNQMPERCFSLNEKGQPEVQIIGWGQWANFFQRHLCDALKQDFEFLQDMWGVPDYAAQF
jgi:hypothetical protein